MSEFKVGSEFGAAWKDAIQDGKVTQDELKKLGELAKKSCEADDDKMLAGLTKQYQGCVDEINLSVGGTAPGHELKTKVAFVAKENDTESFYSVAIAPKDVTPENVEEYIRQKKEQFGELISKIEQYEKENPIPDGDPAFEEKLAKRDAPIERFNQELADVAIKLYRMKKAGPGGWHSHQAGPLIHFMAVNHPAALQLFMKEKEKKAASQ